MLHFFLQRPSPRSLGDRRGKNIQGAKKEKRKKKKGMKRKRKRGARGKETHEGASRVSLSHAWLAPPIFFMRLLRRLVTSDLWTNLPSLSLWCPVQGNLGEGGFLVGDMGNHLQRLLIRMVAIDSVPHLRAGLCLKWIWVKRYAEFGGGFWNWMWKALLNLFRSIANLPNRIAKL